MNKTQLETLKKKYTDTGNEAQLKEAYQMGVDSVFKPITYDFQEGDYVDTLKMNTREMQMVIDRMIECGAEPHGTVECLGHLFYVIMWDCDRGRISFYSLGYVMSHPNSNEVKWEDICNEII